MKNSKNAIVRNIDFIVSEVKCSNCKHVFSTWARQLSYLGFEVNICPQCAIQQNEGKFTQIKQTF